MNRYQELIVIGLAILVAAVLIYLFPSQSRAAPIVVAQSALPCAHYIATGRPYKCRLA